ncbi:hypothetical protein PQQ51_31550 [Paraburkholderia xenovorans]|uniref:hypothetical protein n=1 Tax=Paraburkholderia xenovorans TaxID=36873 RepID=UPI0038BD73F3
MDAALIWQIGGTLVAAGAAYAAIRTDLRNMHERIAALETRFNNHIEKGLTHGNS